MTLGAAVPLKIVERGEGATPFSRPVFASGHPKFQTCATLMPGQVPTGRGRLKVTMGPAEIAEHIKSVYRRTRAFDTIMGVLREDVHC